MSRPGSAIALCYDGMPRVASYSGSFDEMPLSVQRAASVPRDYYAQALCRPGESSTPSIAWTVEPGKKQHVVAGVIYDGDTLVELALLTCRICPVQWECASVAIAADEKAGIWSDTLDNLRVFREAPDVLLVLKERGVPVQVAAQRVADGIS